MFQETLERLKRLGGDFTSGIGQGTGVNFATGKSLMKKPMINPVGKKKSRIEGLLEQLAGMSK